VFPCLRGLLEAAEDAFGRTARVRITCDKAQTRCIDEITPLCRGKSFIIVTERAQEINPSGVLEGVHRAYNNLYWLEARCDQF